MLPPETKATMPRWGRVRPDGLQCILHTCLEAAATPAPTRSQPNGPWVHGAVPFKVYWVRVCWRGGLPYVLYLQTKREDDVD